MTRPCTKPPPVPRLWTCARTCLDATLLTITAADGAFTACCYGDGVVVLGRQDGRLGSPCRLVCGQLPELPKLPIGRRSARPVAGAAGQRKTVEHWTLSADGTAEESDVPQPRRLRAIHRHGGRVPLRRRPQRRRAVVHRNARNGHLADAALGPSDGGSARAARLQGQPRPVRPAPRQAFSKECHARRWQHADDFSLGVVWLAAS